MLYIIEFILICFIIYRLLNIIKRYKAISIDSYPHPLERLRQALKPVFGKGKFLDVIMFEIKIIYYGIVTFLFKKVKSISTEYTFTYAKSSQFKVVAIVFTVIIIAESVLVHILLEQFVLSKYNQLWAHILPWLVHLMNVYVIMFFLAQHKAIHDLPHNIIDGNLIINNGILGSVTIPLFHIESIQKAKPLELGEKENTTTFYAYNKVDSPDFEIVLTEPAIYTGAYGKRKNVNRVVMKVDDPQTFLNTINSLQTAP